MGNDVTLPIHRHSAKHFNQLGDVIVVGMDVTSPQNLMLITGDLIKIDVYIINVLEE